MNEASAEPAAKRRDYDAIAPIYEALSTAYSFGLIRRSKKIEVKYMKRGDKVLYFGVGSGEEVATAARKGCRVTAVDLSAEMIERLRRRLAKRNLSAELIVADALAHRPQERYDAVCGNYFFNVFNKADMPIFLRHAGDLVKPGGRLMIADMAPPSGLSAPLTWLYLKSALGLFVLLRLASHHPIYDYQSYGREAGLDVEAVHDFGWPVLFQTVVLRRPLQDDAGSSRQAAFDSQAN